jgi:hypothetical protein
MFCKLISNQLATFHVFGFYLSAPIKTTNPFTKLVNGFEALGNYDLPA